MQWSHLGGTGASLRGLPPQHTAQPGKRAPQTVWPAGMHIHSMVSTSYQQLSSLLPQALVVQPVLACDKAKGEILKLT